MQIAPGIYSLGQRRGGNVHAAILDDGIGLTLIDALYDTDAHIILNEIKSLGKQVTDLKRIILTHGHRSHLGGLAVLKRLSGATVYSHDWEADIIAGKREAQRVSAFPQKPLQVYPLQLGLALGLAKHPPCPVDQNLKDGDHAGPLAVIHVPGHTPGCLAFYWPERRALFAGDVIATWPEIALGWPGLTLDNKQNRDSVGRLVDVTNAEILCVGHGEPILTGAAETIRGLVDRPSSVRTQAASRRPALQPST